MATSALSTQFHYSDGKQQLVAPVGCRLLEVAPCRQLAQANPPATFLCCATNAPDGLVGVE